MTINVAENCQLLFTKILAYYGKCPYISLDADDDIPATPIIDIISERANRMDKIFRVPAGFKFDPLPFDSPAADQILNVYGKGHIQAVL